MYLGARRTLAPLFKRGYVPRLAPIRELILWTVTLTWLSILVTRLRTCGGTFTLATHTTGSTRRPRKHANCNIRNFGIMVALMVFGCCGYLIATEYISAQKSKGEVLLFRRSKTQSFSMDEEANRDATVTASRIGQETSVPSAPAGLHKQTSIFHWDGVCYDIKLKKEELRLLDHVDGWVKPGTLTALMVRSFSQELRRSADNVI